MGDITKQGTFSEDPRWAMSPEFQRTVLISPSPPHFPSHKVGIKIDFRCNKMSEKYLMNWWCYQMLFLGIPGAFSSCFKGLQRLSGFTTFLQGHCIFYVVYNLINLNSKLWVYCRCRVIHLSVRYVGLSLEKKGCPKSWFILPTVGIKYTTLSTNTVC